MLWRFSETKNHVIISIFEKNRGGGSFLFFVIFGIFHDIFMDLHASSWKSQISASMFPNFVTTFLLKSTSKCLPNNMIIRFFGYVVLKISIMEDYVPELNYNENLIEFYENCIFHAFLMNLNASTSKIKSLRVCLQILWYKFCWRVLQSVYRMTCLSDFFDTWLLKFQSWKIAFLNWNTIEIW